LLRQVRRDREAALESKRLAKCLLVVVAARRDEAHLLFDLMSVYLVGKHFSPAVVSVHLLFLGPVSCVTGSAHGPNGPEPRVSEGGFSRAWLFAPFCAAVPHQCGLLVHRALLQRGGGTGASAARSEYVVQQSLHLFA
jgi:hypothetical protein